MASLEVKPSIFYAYLINFKKIDRQGGMDYGAGVVIH